MDDNAEVSSTSKSVPLSTAEPVEIVTLDDDDDDVEAAECRTDKGTDCNIEAGISGTEHKTGPVTHVRNNWMEAQTGKDTCFRTEPSVSEKNHLTATVAHEKNDDANANLNVISSSADVGGNTGTKNSWSWLDDKDEEYKPNVLTKDKDVQSNVKNDKEYSETGKGNWWTDYLEEKAVNAKGNDKMEPRNMPKETKVPATKHASWLDGDDDDDLSVVGLSDFFERRQAKKEATVLKDSQAEKKSTVQPKSILKDVAGKRPTLPKVHKPGWLYNQPQTSPPLNNQFTQNPPQNYGSPLVYGDGVILSPAPTLGQSLPGNNPVFQGPAPFPSYGQPTNYTIHAPYANAQQPDPVVLRERPTTTLFIPGYGQVNIVGPAPPVILPPAPQPHYPMNYQQYEYQVPRDLHPNPVYNPVHHPQPGNPSRPHQPSYYNARRGNFGRRGWREGSSRNTSYKRTPDRDPTENFDSDTTHDSSFDANIGDDYCQNEPLGKESPTPAPINKGTPYQRRAARMQMRESQKPVKRVNLNPAVNRKTKESPVAKLRKKFEKDCGQMFRLGNKRNKQPEPTPSPSPPASLFGEENESTWSSSPSPQKRAEEKQMHVAKKKDRVQKTVKRGTKNKKDKREPKSKSASPKPKSQQRKKVDKEVARKSFRGNVRNKKRPQLAQLHSPPRSFNDEFEADSEASKERISFCLTPESILDAAGEQSSESDASVKRLTRSKSVKTAIEKPLMKSSVEEIRRKGKQSELKRKKAADESQCDPVEQSLKQFAPRISKATGCNVIGPNDVSVNTGLNKIMTGSTGSILNLKLEVKQETDTEIEAGNYTVDDPSMTYMFPNVETQFHEPENGFADVDSSTAAVSGLETQIDTSVQGIGTASTESHVETQWDGPRINSSDDNNMHCINKLKVEINDDNDTETQMEPLATDGEVEGSANRVIGENMNLVITSIRSSHVGTQSDDAKDDDDENQVPGVGLEAQMDEEEYDKNNLIITAVHGNHVETRLDDLEDGQREETVSCTNLISTTMSPGNNMVDQSDAFPDANAL